MKAARVQSPTRVDLAGGTLDLWPLYNFVGGALTLNVAIDVWTEAEVLPGSDAQIRLESPDVELDETFANLQQVLKSQNPKLKLFQPLLRQLRPEAGFHLKTRSQSPVGGGLGGSSSLMISILKCFELAFGQKPLGAHELVHWAHNLEAEILRTPTGTQDYYPAVSGGVNLLRSGPRGLEQEVLPIAGQALEKKFLLVYTGRSHHSGLNNFEVLKSAVAGDSKVLSALGKIREVALQMEPHVRAGRWDQLAPLFDQEYEARLELTPAFTCPEIESLNRLSRQAGAESVKICGAGGGGCVMVWCPEDRRETIAEVCRKAGFQVMNARPVGPLAALRGT